MGDFVKAMNYFNTYSINLWCIFSCLHSFSAYQMIENPATTSISFIVRSETSDVHLNGKRYAQKTFNSV